MVTVTLSPEASAQLLLNDITRKARADRQLRHLCDFPHRDNKPNDVLDLWVDRNVVSILKKDHAEVCWCACACACACASMRSVQYSCRHPINRLQSLGASVINFCSCWPASSVSRQPSKYECPLKPSVAAVKGASPLLQVARGGIYRKVDGIIYEGAEYLLIDVV